ncbi:hypothetical protein [Auraticoccus monumenti]|uniref:Uncharacterized protein n=1 Tax=Auraticoccus monumenti TaxID=675864 RepID=A0A1G6XGA1_9ACTN|nr:hypothetical protein [Auraticoccus monumenti]SDD76347.1 hypothetical protein SAMN04489747_1684 [Auraticoccus monumenti]
MPASRPPRDDRDLKAALGREARLYGLGLVCATPAALAVWRTGSIWVGVMVFLAVLGVAGSALLVHERKRAARPRAEDQRTALGSQVARERARLDGAEQTVADEARRVAEQERREQHAARQRSGGSRRRGRSGGRRR